MNLTSRNLRLLKPIPFLGIAGLLLFAGAVRAPAQTDPRPDELAFFEKKIRPVLVERCYKCHSHESEKLKGGLYLDSLAGALAGGDTGPSIEPGHPDKSLVIEAIRYKDTDLEMPPKGKLDDDAIADLTKWIEMGAPWPKEDAPSGGGGAVEEFDLEKRMAKHWCWQPIRKSNPPSVKDESWPESAIDRFILARLEDSGMKPAPHADPRTLIRRICFDLTGLPPSTSQVAAFVDGYAEDPESKIENLVDELLASPHFGERWGRHWLDLTRYAETLGHEFDYPIDHAYRYRDYVIRAFNADVPYNQLIREHVAGDLLAAPRRHPVEDYNESIIGSGFWFYHEATHAPTDVRGNEADHVDNRIDVFSKTFLGLTVACARCHDHKFDAIATSDYYALAGYLQSSRQQDAMLDPGRKIAAAKAELTELKETADKLLPAAFGAGADADVFSSYLLAARDAEEGARRENSAPTPKMIAEAARKRGVDPGRLERWVAALRDPAASKPEHPLFAWTLLLSPDTDWEKMRSQVETVRSEMAAAREEAVLFEDFDGGALDGWFLTGHAFSDRPTAGAEWSAGTRHQVAKSGVAHSGLYGDRFCGVLRSPTFEITHPFLHLRMKATNVSVRLIIDGYQLAKRHSLLFNGTLLKENDSDTGGQYVWKTLDGYKGGYVGHKAWFEFIDQGDGFVAVDEILFTNDPLPPIRYGPVTERLVLAEAAEEGPTPETLARAFAGLWSESLAGLGSGEFEDSHEAIVNWTWENDLLPINEPALANAKERAGKRGETVPPPMFAVAHADGTPENDRVHIRGSHTNLGEEVPRRFLLAFDGGKASAPANGSGRLELADRLTDPANPLPARVMVNRIWHHLFGRGIVPTVDDFGEMGQPPSHPELLDWLAANFVENGWSIKKTIREVVLSKTYRMSSTAAADLSPAVVAERDPDNALLHRMPVRRLQAEAIRDAMLAVSGRLDSAMFGPSVPTYLTNFMEGRGRPKTGPMDGDGRRSIYLEVRRNFLNPMMLAFDMPSPFSTMGRRSVSNVPAQALVLMNDPFVVEQSRRWARGVLKRGTGVDQRITAMFEDAFTRPPTPDELSDMRNFLASQADLYFSSGLDDERLWADLAHVLFNKKEFIYIN